MKKKIVTIAMLAALAAGSAAALTGCGGGEAASSAAPESSSSAPETVSSEAASESSVDGEDVPITLDTEGMDVVLLGTIVTKKGQFAESPEEIAKRFSVTLDFMREDYDKESDDYKIRSLDKDSETGDITFMMESGVGIVLAQSQTDKNMTDYVMVMDLNASKKSDVTRFVPVIAMALYGNAGWEGYTPTKSLNNAKNAEDLAYSYLGTSTMLRYNDANSKGDPVPTSFFITALE